MASSFGAASRIKDEQFWFFVIVLPWINECDEATTEVYLITVPRQPEVDASVAPQVDESRQNLRTSWSADLRASGQFVSSMKVFRSSQVHLPTQQGEHHPRKDRKVKRSKVVFDSGLGLSIRNVSSFMPPVPVQPVRMVASLQPFLSHHRLHGNSSWVSLNIGVMSGHAPERVEEAPPLTGLMGNGQDRFSAVWLSFNERGGACSYLCDSWMLLSGLLDRTLSCFSFPENRGRGGAIVNR